MLRFYTLPPSGICWPFLLVNPRNWRVLLKRKFEHAILDCGVEFFEHNPTANEYPERFLKKWQQLACYATRIFGDKLFVTIPDYPDDYHPGQVEDNVEKTLMNIQKFVGLDTNVHWLPSLQAKYLNPFTFFEACQRTKELLGNYPQIAIGTVCKTKKLEFIEYCCKVARTFFPCSRIHGFGLTIRALPKVKTLLDSFDSLAYTFPLPGLAVGYNGIWGQARDLPEKRLYFQKYVERVESILTN